MSSIESRAAGLANAALSLIDAQVVRRSTLGRRSHRDVLARAKAGGVAPNTAIDVGAAKGDWTRACHAAFPAVQHVLVEPLAEFHPALELLARGLPRSTVVHAAAAEGPGSVELNVHEDLVGSSILRESEGRATDGSPRTVAKVSIDDTVRELRLRGPFILKVDAQGAELRVLDGSGDALAATDLLVLEASLLPFFEGGPLLAEVVAYMQSRAFDVYDIFGLNYRPLDGALAQVDLAFVPRNSPLRNDFRYATPRQRAKQTDQFLRDLSR